MSVSAGGHLSDQDLIPDRALRESDVDAFEHGAIVENLARHIECGDGPLNIALYGPWGSGKSSVYEMLARRFTDRPVMAVRYDAWRFGGESLQRNFISHAANELGFDAKHYRQYHDGLFEGRRQADVDLTDLQAWKRPMLVFAAVLGALLCIVSAIAVVVSFLTDRGPLDQVGVVLSGFFIPAAVGSLVVAAIKAVMDGATVTVEQSKPSAEDQFAKRFDELVTAARRKHRAERLLFFIDELDRCSPDDVVATLTAIKTFLDRDDCVFVVAADRQVLEAALKSHLAQATPADEDHPYYSSASAFLDKVFHHQVYLPPLRPVSLTRFARDLVKDRGGIWEEIRIHGGQRELDSVIYTLIPSHVVSPRRVKVLLNNFASNLRIAQSRNIFWVTRVLELAKLTVLQTEFPNLAHDLPDAPDLPDLLIATDEPEKVSAATRRLLERHALGKEGDGTEGPADSEAPDPLVDSPVSSAAKTRAIEVTQKHNLRRYLERCQARDIPSPKRDLLYLGTLGPTYGLGDTGLAEELETLAREAPRRVIESLQDRSRREREAAAKILADLSRHEFGLEKENCITAMLGATDLAEISADTGERLVVALNDALSDGHVADGDLAKALSVALASKSVDGQALARGLVAKDELLSEPERVEEVASNLHRLPPESRPSVIAAVASRLPDHLSALTGPLSRLPDETARAVLHDEDVREAVLALAEDEDGSDESADPVAGIYNALDGKPLAKAELQWDLVTRGFSYDNVREHADEVLATISSPSTRTSHAISGLEYGPPEDWHYWSEHLDVTAEHLEWWDESLSTAATRVMAEGDELVASRLAPFVGRLAQQHAEPIASAVRERLSGSEWWTSRDAANSQATVYRLAQKLGSESVTITSAVEQVIRSDFDRVRTVPVNRGQPNSPARATTASDLDATVVLAGSLPQTTRNEARDWIISDALVSDDADIRAGAASAVVELTHAIAAAGGSPTVPKARTVLGALSNDQRGRATIRKWLELGPETAMIVEFATILGHEVHPPVENGLGAWAGRTTEAERTATVTRLLESEPSHSGWIVTIARHGIDEPQLVSKIRAQIAQASRAEERRALAGIAVDLHSSSPRARRTAGLIVEDLLDRHTQHDYATAMRLVPTLGRDHQSAARIKEALDRAWNADHRLEITPKWLTALRDAGIEPKKRNLSSKAAKSDSVVEKAARGLLGRFGGR